MVVKVIRKETDEKLLLEESILKFNLDYGFEYYDMIKEGFDVYNENLGLAMGIIRYQRRMKLLTGNEVERNFLLSIDGKESLDVYETLQGIEKKFLINSLMLYEFLHTNNNPKIALLNYEAQKFRYNVLRDEKEDVSCGRCFSLANHLGEICIQRGINATIAYIEQYHATLVVDGICIDGSWLDGSLFNNEEMEKATNLRDLDFSPVEYYKIVDLNEFNRRYRNQEFSKGET